ncbi:MAG: hypothetical protein ACE5FF_17435 [Saprospiraceae bacterium]
MKKAIWMTAGFLLFILGFSALVLSLVGVNFSFLTWLDAAGSLFGFLLRVLMITGGIVIVYLTVTDRKARE